MHEEAKNEWGVLLAACPPALHHVGEVFLGLLKTGTENDESAWDLKIPRDILHSK